MEQSAADLKAKIADLEAEVARYKRESLGSISNRNVNKTGTNSNEQRPCVKSAALTLTEYRRYGRQMLLPSVGLPGQLRLKSSSALIIGVGGLGSPASIYLAGAGVGTIGLIDGDTVEEGNLHRQIVHSTAKVGWSKVASAAHFLKELNPNVDYICHEQSLSIADFDILAQYDLILDCTDTPRTRYLISDMCVLLSKPFVSAAALKTDGQLSVFNWPPGRAPCYRCLWPRPPPAELLTTCGESGILGPVVGAMGVMMAGEAIRVLLDPSKHAKASGIGVGHSEDELTSLLIYSYMFQSPGEAPIKSIKVRRKAKCRSCGEPPESALKITRSMVESGDLDYVAFCGTRSIQQVEADHRVNVVDLKEWLDKRGSTPSEHSGWLLDVREEIEFGISSLKGSINMPISKLTVSVSDLDGASPETEALGTYQAHNWPPDPSDVSPIFIVCKFGNDSQLAVHKLLNNGLGLNGAREIRDVIGGLDLWKRQVDSSFPAYW